jgi:hypothetical protein
MTHSQVVKVEIEFDWVEVGKITLNGTSDIHVPKALREPAVYKICKDCKEYAEDLEGSVVEDSLVRAVNEEFELRQQDGEDPHY